MKVGSLFFPFILPHRPGWQTSFPPIRLEWHAGKAQKERIFAGIALLFEYLCHCYSEVDTSGSIELLISWPAINTPCEKCGSGEFEDGNTIVYCSQCDIGYHQSCHRISVLPAAKEPWYCRDCQALKEFYTRLHADPQVICPHVWKVLIPAESICWHTSRSPRLKPTSSANLTMSSEIIPNTPL